MQKVVLVRHGQTVHNRLGLIQGRTDTPLNEEGEAQARRLAVELAGVDFDTVYSSPLQRALCTARLTMKGRSIPITTDDRLVEIDQGDWTLKNTRELFNAEQRYRTWVANPTLAGPPNGETIFDVAKRAKSFAEDMQGNSILVVAHGGLIAILRAVIESKPLEKAWELLTRNGEVVNLIIK